MPDTRIAARTTRAAKALGGAPEWGKKFYWA
jgi:hypothetical protein